MGKGEGGGPDEERRDEEGEGEGVWASDLEMGAWDAEDERMDLFVEELQSPLLYELLASRHILYSKSERSYIFYAKPLAIRTGEEVVNELESVVPDDDTLDSGGDDAVGETLVVCIQTSERMESEDWDIISCVSELSWMEGEEA